MSILCRNFLLRPNSKNTHRPCSQRHCGIKRHRKPNTVTDIPMLGINIDAVIGNNEKPSTGDIPVSGINNSTSSNQQTVAQVTLPHTTSSMTDSKPRSTPSHTRSSTVQPLVSNWGIIIKGTQNPLGNTTDHSQFQPQPQIHQYTQKL